MTSPADDLRALLANERGLDVYSRQECLGAWAEANGAAVLALLDAAQALDAAYTPRPLTAKYRPKVVAVIEAARALSEPRP